MKRERDARGSSASRSRRAIESLNVAVAAGILLHHFRE